MCTYPEQMYCNLSLSFLLLFLPFLGIFVPLRTFSVSAIATFFETHVLYPEEAREPVRKKTRSLSLRPSRLRSRKIHGAPSRRRGSSRRKEHRKWSSPRRDRGSRDFDRTSRTRWRKKFLRRANEFYLRNGAYEPMGARVTSRGSRGEVGREILPRTSRGWTRRYYPRYSRLTLGMSEYVTRENSLGRRAKYASPRLGTPRSSSLRSEVAATASSRSRAMFASSLMRSSWHVDTNPRRGSALKW